MIAMFISFYTVRVLLSVIGDDDLGIYKVVEGMVVLFLFLNVAFSLSKIITI